MKELPPKKVLILRVELSSKQKEYYKAILTRNYEILIRKGGAQISLIIVVMELRKLYCHAYMLEGVEPNIADANEAFDLARVSFGFIQMVCAEDGDLSGLEDVSSDGEDDTYEAELTVKQLCLEYQLEGGLIKRKPVVRFLNSAEPLPLMEGEADHLEFGFGEYDWAESALQLKQKT
ncbi:chromatin remodeling factor CHD3 [Actinidia rufa]|uniref:Chromatin remodeling factor CHD3 n=1 Tax=Actinidia rufa TaxID=165716 RepID=A0A7J0GBZ2_9ERIC|nr:chromatin remodeling factor CHD3 [Actinidia rufa]